MKRSALLVGLTALFAAGCTGGDPATKPAPDSRVGNVSTVASDLDVPWAIAFLPDGGALVTERDAGRVLHLTADGAPRQVRRFDVDSGGESGLLGIALSSQYAEDHLVYVYYTAAEDNRVVRFPYDGEHAGAARPVLTGIPKGAIHDGGRIAFGPDGMLYVGTGETGHGDLAQDRSSLGGKILRVRPDGTVPGDNPFPGLPVWSYGHRNVEGLAWDDAGRLYATEFGPDRDDEINRIAAGQNYGWPIVVGKAGDQRFTDPLVTFPTGEFSASGATIAGGALWTAALRGERLWRVPLAGDGTLGEPESLFDGRFGRLRAVVTAPDGALWISTSNRDGRGDPGDHDDRILRVPLPGAAPPTR